MSSFVRSSKFRHVYADSPRVDATFQNLRLSTVTGEQNYIKANPLYFAVGLQGGGGPLAIIPLNKPGKCKPDIPYFSGHSGPVLDFDFNPFHDHIIASGSEDMSIKIWGIPEGGLTTNIDTPLVDLAAHNKKVTLLRFHPTASNVLCSASADHFIKLWDIEKGAEMNAYSNSEDLIQDVVWDYTGAQYAVSSKDKRVRLVDARTAQIVSVIENAHAGAKSTKLTFLGNQNKFISVGFTRQSQREFKIWDQRNTSDFVERVDIDQAAGVVMPFYDPDTCLLYLAGKGDGNVRFYEIGYPTETNGKTVAYPLSEHRSNTSAKGMAFVPKRGLNIMGCETARLLKLTTNSVEPLMFLVPRKSESFQDDLYPHTSSNEPVHSAEEWFAGSELPPKLMSLNPNVKSSGSSEARPTSFKAPKTNAELIRELDAANARIKELEEKLAAAGLS
eukprot:gene9242-12456_t